MTTPALGTPEHAMMITQGRHPGVKAALAWLAFSHLPEALQNYSRPFYQTAVEMITNITEDSPELTTSLNKLIEAKDSGVRAGIRFDNGRPGPVPRPATVVDPPRGMGPGYLGPVAAEDLMLQGNYGAGVARPRPTRRRPTA